MEPILRADLGSLLAAAVDGAAIKGGGVNEPSGILNTTLPTMRFNVAPLDAGRRRPMLTLAEAKLQLRISEDDLDAEIVQVIAAAADLDLHRFCSGHVLMLGGPL
ncbi:hypothetical protein, partial [Haematobacter missouriensis]|uniref:hypothetical protein n=1 Tax=Haematobacter missouriensis TaxID=366616 RepID=UPI0023F25DEF